MKNKYLCCPYKNYYYLCKLNIPEIDLIEASINMSKV